MAYIYDLSDTWNAAGTTFYGIKMNVTNSASAAASRLLSLQVGSVEQAWVGPTGSAYFAGNVGIGTSSPSTYNGLLNVKAADRAVIGYFGGTTYATRLGANSSYATVEAVDAATGVSSYRPLQIGGSLLKFDTGGSERMRIDASGNVGIGTSSPSQKLHVSGAQLTVPAAGWTSGQVAYSYLGDTNNGISAANGGNTNVFGFNGITFSSTGFGGEKMRLTSAGNLLVGTTSPLGGNTASEFKQTAAGSWPLALNANDRGLLIRNSAASSGFYAYFEYNNGPNNNGSISWSGGTTSYNTTSDARIKDNIVDAPDAGDLIDGIKVRSWDFKADGAHWRYGMVAQELLEVAPEAVSVPADEEMMMGVDYSKLVPMLVKEVQSLRARVAQLEGN